MLSKFQEYIKNEFKVDKKVLDLAALAEKQAEDEFHRIDEIKEYNQLKVIKAMQNNFIDDTHFNGTTGYGYNDKGREALESVFKRDFWCRGCIGKRHQIVSGTHALSICLYGNLRPGKKCCP